MDVSAVTSAPPLGVARVHPDESRRRATNGAAMGGDPQTAFHLPADEAFGSAAPVAVGAMTEVAVADLQPVDGLPLAEAIHRYADQD